MVRKRVFVVGDIHGRLSALNEVLDAAGFRNDKDRLISLGDECDGGSKTKEVINRLLEIEDRVDIQGNHDYYWFRPWAMWVPGETPRPPETSHWENMGGLATCRSYGHDPHNIPQEHIDFLNKKIPYYLYGKRRIFVHGGFNPRVAITKQDPYFIAWDRKLIKYAQYKKVPNYDRVFVGHTSTQFYKKLAVVRTEDGEECIAYLPATEPVQFHNLVMCDCGAGWSGRLALVNVNNPNEYWLSQFQVPEYEPGEGEVITDRYI